MARAPPELQPHSVAEMAAPALAGLAQRLQGGPLLRRRQRIERRDGSLNRLHLDATSYLPEFLKPSLRGQDGARGKTQEKPMLDDAGDHRQR